MKNIDKIESLLTPKSDDLHLALTLLYGMRKEPLFAGIPELLAIVGWKSLLDLSHYCGGEVFKIPTESELLLALQAMQLYASGLNGETVKGETKELRDAVDFIDKHLNDQLNVGEINQLVKDLCNQAKEEIK